MRLPGFVRRVIFLTIGFIFAVPCALFQLLYFVFLPRRYLKRRNYSALETAPPLPDLHHEMVDVGDGISIHTVRTFQGNPAKPVMVLVHGFPEYWGSWRRQIQEFRNEYDIIAISPRGYCMSSKPKGYMNYTTPKLVNDIFTVIHSLGVGKVVLMGHDWGGGLCWYTAILHPELISKLIVACAPHPKLMMKNMNVQQLFSSWYMFLFQFPYLPELIIKAEDYKSFDSLLCNPPMGVRRLGAISQADMDVYKKEIDRPGALTASLNYYRAMMRSTAYGIESLALKESMQRPLQVPTLCIWADCDQALRPQLLNGLGRYVDSLRVKVLENCSHYAQQDRPEEFNAAVREFLAGNES
jgi:pimeloyl-ACP methyl ester carboxylesterase